MTSMNRSSHLLSTRPEAAETLKVCTRTVDRMIADGQLPAVRIRGRVLIPVEAIDRLIRPELDQAA